MIRPESMPEMPLVSVIVCVYNAGEYLRSSIESVLAQTYRNLEILVVDDGSTDGCMRSIEDLRDPRLRIHAHENRGKPASMNEALGMIKGDFYALHDADDLSHPRRIELQVKAMLEHPELAAVFSGHELILDGRHVAPVFGEKSMAECKDDIDTFNMPAHDPTGMYRMSMVRELRYRPELFIGEGFDYILRVGEMHPVMVVGECLYSYRIHMKSVTNRNPEQRVRLVREVLRLACERRNIDFAARFPPTAPGFTNRDMDNNMAAHFMESAANLHSAGRYGEAVRTGMACIRLQPTDPHYYKALLYALVPSAVRRALRPSERRRRNALKKADPAAAVPVRTPS